MSEVVNLCRPKVVASYPITPQTHIVEELAKMKANGIYKGKYICADSEFSAMSMIIGASATGVRTFTATSSQGLALMHELLFAASGMRLPLVMIVANRALSAPLNIWCFTKDARVLMADLTYKPIDMVKKGELVLGKDKKGNLKVSKVKKLFRRKTSELVELRTDKFNLMCTPNHEFYYRNGHRHWTKAKNLKGKNLHYFGYNYEINAEFKRGWLAGVSDGDGCFFKDKLNRFSFNLKVRDKELVDVFEKWSNESGFNLRKVDYHKKRGFHSIVLTKNKETLRFQNFLCKNKNFDFLRGYIAGIYDAEGSGPYKVKQAVIYNSNLSIIDFIVESLKELNINFKVYVDTRRDGKYKRDNYHVKINNVPEFFIKCRPILERKRNNLFKMSLSSIKSRLRITDTRLFNKSREVYNLETETNNYVVNGFLVHNCDQQDSVSERDSGWVQLYAESNQEAVDLIPQAYRLAEDLLIPVMVCVDGFYLTHTYEPIDVPTQEEIDGFLPGYKPDRIYLDPEKPVTMGPVALPSVYLKFKKEQWDAMEEARKNIPELAKEFETKFRRKQFSFIEEYKTEGKEKIIVTMGSLAGTIKDVIDERSDAGLVRVKSFRPFPEKELASALKGKEVIVIEKDVSFGIGGALYSELKGVVAAKKTSCWIAGLGGKDITRKQINEIIDNPKEGVNWLE